jgi:hypothetical protein
MSKITLLGPDQNLFPNWHFHSRGANYEKYTKNPTPEDKKSGITGPCLTKIKRFENGREIDYFMKIEFSVSKLLFHNSIDEIQETNFSWAVSALRQRLIDMGVVVSEKNIENAFVYTFHPAKNIILSGGYTASFAIAEIAKINLHKKFDLTKTVWTTGQSLQIYSTSYSLVFYDKIAENNQSKKKSIDRDKTPQQYSLLSGMKKRSPSAEILRFEVRICNKKKLNSLMKNLGFPENPTFKDIFKENISQKILKFYWATIVKNETLFIFELLEKPENLLGEMLENDRKIKLKEMMYLLALNILCKRDGGIRGLRKIIEKYFSTKTWYSITKGIKRLNKIRENNPVVHNWVLQVDETIEKFEPFRVNMNSIND